MLYEQGVSSEGNKQRVAVVVSHELAHQVWLVGWLVDWSVGRSSRMSARPPVLQSVRQSARCILRRLSFITLYSIGQSTNQ